MPGENRYYYTKEMLLQL